MTDEKIETTAVTHRGEELQAKRVVKITEFMPTTTRVVEMFPEKGKKFSIPSVLQKFKKGDTIFQEHNLNKKRLHWKVADTAIKMQVSNPKNGFDLAKDIPSIPNPIDFTIAESHWKGLIYCILSNKPVMITGYSGSGKTTLATLAGSVLNRPVEVFNMGATQDPRTTLIGVTQLNQDGTLFRPARFVEAVTTPNTVVVLDELTRANPDAWNILIPALDGQRYIALDESESGDKVPIHPTVSFVSTANMGIEYTSTSVLDRAVLDRFRMLELPFVSEEQEKKLFVARTGVAEESAKNVAEICAITRKEWKKDDGKLSTPVSTRAGLAACEMIATGFDLQEAAEFNMLPFYEDEGDESERTFLNQLLQKYIQVDSDVFDDKEAEDNTGSDDDVPFPKV